MPAAEQQAIVICSLKIREHYHEPASAELSGGNS